MSRGTLFRTAKYRPEFPARGFPDLDTARDRASRFVHWYNQVHRHSGIRYITPAQRHAGEDRPLLEVRHAVYLEARDATRRGGAVRPATGTRSARSRSTRSGTAWSRRHWPKPGFPVRLARLLSRPGLITAKPRRATQGKRGAEPPTATRSARFGASMKRVGPRSGPTSTGPSPK